MSEQITKTNQEFKEVLSECKALFYKKLHDYGASWRILRPSSLTDQLFIKSETYSFYRDNEREPCW